MYTQSYQHQWLPSPRYSGGSSLIELMIALSIALILLSCIFRLYFVSHQNILYSTELLNLQNQTSLVDLLLRRSVHQAGYSGCGVYQWPQSIIDTQPDPESKPQSDTLTLWHASDESALLARRMRSYHFFYLPKSFEVNAHEKLFISDCLHNETITVKKVSKALHDQIKITTEQSLIHLYDVTAAVYHIQRETYFVTETERHVDTLFIRTETGEKDEVAEYVSQMKITSQTKDMISIKFSFITPHFKQTFFVNAALKNA